MLHVTESLRDAYYTAGARTTLGLQAFADRSKAIESRLGPNTILSPVRANSIMLAGVMGILAGSADTSGLEWVTNHASNAGWGIIAGGGAALVASTTYDKIAERPLPIAARATAFIGAAAAAVAANAIIETPYMSELFADEPGTGRVDPVDYYVGIAAGTAAGASAKIKPA